MPSREPSSTPERVRGAGLGLLGGTFDPPHLGHLAAARAVRTALGLDRVDLMPANDPWQKTGDGRTVTPAAVRLEMVRALVQGEPGVGVDDREIRRGGTTYTADTLEEIHREKPGVRVFLILGADAARGLRSWRRPEVVTSLSTIVVVNRGHEAPVDLPGSVDVAMDTVDVSSTFIREAVSRGADVTDLVGPAVAAVIAGRRLYGPTG